MKAAMTARRCCKAYLGCVRERLDRHRPRRGQAHDSEIAVAFSTEAGTADFLEQFARVLDDVAGRLEAHETFEPWQLREVN